MKLLLLVLLTLVETWSTSPLPVTLGGLSIGSPGELVGERLGKPERVLDEDLRLYPGGLLVRTRDGKVVNLTAGGGWDLRQGEAVLLPRGLGEPKLRYRRGPLVVSHYPSMTADVGVMRQGEVVVGYILTEPGMLGWSLEQSGYVQEASSAPTP